MKLNGYIVITIIILILIITIIFLIKYNCYDLEIFNTQTNINPNLSEFPNDTDDKYFSIQYKNSTNQPIIIWLDDQPFCQNVKNDIPCRQGTPTLPSTDWTNGLAKFYILNNTNNTWNIKQIPSSFVTRNQILQPNEIWRIVPPVDNNGKPYWCFDQGCKICYDKNNNPSWCPDSNNCSRNCPGVGAWVTPINTKMLAINQITKFEYNINGDLWFDISAVDGINTNASAVYTGCPDNKRTCTIDLNSCPVKSVVDGVSTCPSPKTWSNINACGNDGFGIGDLNAQQLAGCGYGDEPNKGECHKWWSENKCAQQWLNWLQKNPSGEKCDQYGWAYDELIYKEGDSFDKNFNPCKSSLRNTDGTCSEVDENPIKPLIHCPINNGSLNIEIFNILI
jgi:hypothetical protein